MGHFVRPQVKRSDAGRPPLQELQELAISPDLLLFRGQRPPGEKQEFTAKQADAVRAGADGRGDLAKQVDVRLQPGPSCVGEFLGDRLFLPRPWTEIL